MNNTHFHYLLFIVGYLMLFFPSAQMEAIPCQQVPKNPKTSINLTLEYAITNKERARGLMYRSKLPENHGMLFILPYPQKSSLWMLNCLIDLSAAFLDKTGTIREIVDLKAYPHIHNPNFFRQRAVTSSFKASYILEMEKGWFAAHQIQVGDKLFFQLDSPIAFISTQK